MRTGSQPLPCVSGIINTAAATETAGDSEHEAAGHSGLDPSDSPRPCLFHRKSHDSDCRQRVGHAQDFDDESLADPGPGEPGPASSLLWVRPGRLRG